MPSSKDRSQIRENQNDIWSYLGKAAISITNRGSATHDGLTIMGLGCGSRNGSAINQKKSNYCLIFMHIRASQTLH